MYLLGILHDFRAVNFPIRILVSFSTIHFRMRFIHFRSFAPAGKSASNYLRPLSGEFGGAAQGVEPFLQPDDPQPAAHLVAAVFEGGVVSIAQFFVEADAS